MLGGILLLSALAATRRFDVAERAHLARAERAEPARGRDRRFERKLGGVKLIDVARRGRVAALVVVDRDGAVPRDVDAVGAGGQLEARTELELQQPGDLGLNLDDAFAPAGLRRGEPAREALEARAPKGLDARASAKGGKERVGEAHELRRNVRG